ncbi:MAG: amino acid adenylation domain-containing protein, partial [Ktedonobacteraceae bacterium]|nr:amino acid adenylation domain-containing protein [Ktedonobacteraceae bacterium]
MSNVSQRIQSLSPEKRELLARQLQKKGNRFNSFPLSFAQQRLWLLDQLEPGNASYDITTALRLRGTLNIEAFEQSFNLIVQRHESLRTTFAVVQGSPVQVIAPTAHVSLPVVDLSGLGEEAHEAEVQLQADEEARYSFDLAKGLLVRVLLLRLCSDEHVVLLNIHHIIADGWSTNILIRELAVHYTAILAGRPCALPDVPVQYADYAVWQRQWLQGEVLEQQLAYWRKQLASAPALLELPTDRPRPAIQTYQGGTVSLMLPRLVAGHLRNLSQHAQITLSMTLLAIFQLLLYRYTGQEDMVVGTHIANRNRADIEGLIGLFLNTLVLRTDLSGDPSFQELLGRVREVALAAYAHQDVPFDRLIEELNPERSLSHTPLFQVCFNMVNLPTQRSEWPGLTADIFWPREAGAKFDLTLYAYDLDEEIRLELVYNAYLFDEERMLAMLQQFEYLVSQTTRPEEKISRFSLVPPATHSILPDPTAPLSARWEGSVQHLFSQQARRLPEHVAVVDSDEILSYQELDRRANRLAHYLISCGINPGDCVAIYSHRSATLVWAILGILKAGAVYIILDPAYPAARLIDYLALADVRGWLHIAAAGPLPFVLEEYLTTLSCCCRMELPHPVDAELHELDSALPLPIHKTLLACSADDPDIEVGPDDLACITFTSGSTGRPKGVLQRHGPLSHFLPWQQERFGLTGVDRYSMLSGLAHDPLQRDIFTALWLGGTICIPAPEHIGTPGWLAAWLRQEQITIAHLTPAMLQLMTVLSEQVVGSSTLSTLPSLRYAFTVGDVLTKHDVARLWKLAPSVTIVNFYGSTETQRAIGYYIVPRAERRIHEDDLLASNSSIQVQHKEKEIIPLGRGFQDVQLLVLNQAQKLAGVGELGEIYVRSPHLARGYVDDEGLTAARFIRNPFTDNVADRMYKTGDLGRYRPDGNVEYAGRSDQQVKLRGFRIELAEIEAVLGLHPAVQEVVVILREDHAGEKRLVAYIVPSRISPIHGTAQELHYFLATRLPGYMLPSAFVTLEALPVTPNGKVDRRTLPVPEPDSHTFEASEAPRTPTEEILSAIWAKLLGRETIGIYENFFECGGHSLLATQLMARIYDVFQKEVRLQALFTAPTVAGLAAHLEQLQTLDTPSRRPALVPQAREAEHSLFPASFAQERLWFLDQFEPGNTAYTLQAAFRVYGTMEVALLQESIQALVRRHETLRTTFVMVDGTLMQAIHAGSDLPFVMVDLGDLPIDMQEAQIHYYAQRELQRPFDLEHGPLFVFTLMHLSSTAHILLCTIHHSIFDAWSAEVLVRELDILYKALSEGRPASLPALPLQYADYATWQREWLEGGALARQMVYWRQQLAGAPTMLDLPTDHPRPPVQTFRGARTDFALSAMLTRSLTLLSRQKGVTLYMTLLVAFQVLLSRYSGQQDIVIGTPIAGRIAVELEGLIGFFVNTLILRGDLSGNPTFEELLGRGRAVTLEAYAHQEVPFEKLVEALQPERSLSHSPLFQVLFVLQNAPTPVLKLADLTLAPLEVPRLMAKFDLALMMWQEGTCLQGNFEYNTDLFEAATIERMIGHLQTLLEGVVSHPDRRVSRLPLLTSEESQRLLIEWNATRADYPSESCIHHLFEAQAQRTPATVALSYAGEQLTYEALNRRANQLACYLQRRANRRLTLVGLCVERSLDMIVGLLAILKAGAAYVPLDPDYPLERLTFMVHDADIALLLTQKHLTTHLSDPTVPLVYMDSEWEVIAQEAHENLASSVTPEHLAYVIYTSGSTGLPKGVQIAHRGVVNFLSAMRRQPGLGEQDVLLALTSLSFDIAGLELFLPLLVGTRVEIASREEATDGVQLMKRLETAGITMLQATPTSWRMLLEAGWPGSASMKLLCGGEALPPALALQLLKRGGSLWNMYGPTETTIWSTLHRVTGVAGSVPIGRPIANTQVYLLDAQLEPVPVGIPGELYIGGVGLSLGYLGRPDGTAERFVPDPFSMEAGARLYKTGDLARYLPDGALEFLGRNDSQVKLRGFRIELQEIETLLCQHPLIKEAVVTMWEDKGVDETQLIAYIVAHEEAEGGVEGSSRVPERQERIRNQQLHQYLQARLPMYMVPAAFVWLTTLPHTPNGKLDRWALPAPHAGQYTREPIHEEPRTPLEDLLLQLWRQVLRREDVGLHDNFFALGGHSLLAAQLVARVRNIWQVELPLRRLFATPTVVGLAQHIETIQREESGLLMPPIVGVSYTEALPLSFAQQRLWFLDQWEHESSLYTMSLARHLSGQLNIEALERSLNTIVQRHEMLRSTFVLHEGQPVHVISPAQLIPLTVVDVRDLPSTERIAYARQVCVETFQRPFDLSQGPLLRLLLVRLTQTEQILLLTVHHIVFDDWSKGILWRELTVLYEAFSSGKPSPLPELPIQYADFAVWQRHWLQGDVLEHNLAYWKAQLAGAPAVLELPTDHPRPSVQTARGAYRSFTIPAVLTQQLRMLSQQEGVTLFMTLLAAFQVLLLRYSGQEDLVIGTPIANRVAAEVEDLIGCFINTLVLRTDLSGNPSFLTLLGRVREVALQAYAHQDMPFEQLVEALQVERILSHTPLFQVLLVWQMNAFADHGQEEARGLP